MGPDALAVFLAEYRIEFPEAIDRHDGDAIPVTMARDQLRGTRSTLLIDRSGRLRHSFFGAGRRGVRAGRRLHLTLPRRKPDLDDEIDAPAPTT